MNSEQLQRRHYNKILSKIDEYFDSKESMEYRIKFIYPYLLRDLNLSGAKVLDAMCGSGQASEYLVLKNAEVVGLDISERAIKNYKKRFPDSEAICGSMFSSKLKDDLFDYVVVVGGLHHLHPRINRGIDEIHRILKPGGIFCFVEPYKGTIINLFRKIWYMFDYLFEKNEKAINFKEIQREHEHQFDFIFKKYGGNIAFWLVFESAFFRISLKWKKYYAPLLFKLERFFQKFQGKRNSTYFIAQWRKK